MLTPLEDWSSAILLARIEAKSSSDILNEFLGFYEINVFIIISTATLSAETAEILQLFT